MFTAEDVQRFVFNEYGVSYSYSHFYWLLDKLGFSRITSLSKHPKQ
ncbi:winged helix-turn-helix domain-containing protein [Shewanella olleyana]